MFVTVCAITAGQIAGGEKGRPVYDLDDLAEWAGGQWMVLTGCRKGTLRRGLATSGPAGARVAATALMDRFGPENVAMELTVQGLPTDDEENDALAALAGELCLPLVATGGAHYARPSDARLAAAMAAVRARNDLAGADGYLSSSDRFLRSGAEMAQRFARFPGVVDQAHRIGVDCAFDLQLVARACRRSRCRPGTTRTAGCGTWLIRWAGLGSGRPR